jgi:hypothetical protein
VHVFESHTEGLYSIDTGGGVHESIAAFARPQHMAEGLVEDGLFLLVLGTDWLVGCDDCFFQEADSFLHRRVEGVILAMAREALVLCPVFVHVIQRIGLAESRHIRSLSCKPDAGAIKICRCILQECALISFFVLIANLLCPWEVWHRMSRGSRSVMQIRRICGERVPSSGIWMAKDWLTSSRRSFSQAVINLQHSFHDAVRLLPWDVVEILCSG